MQNRQSLRETDIAVRSLGLGLPDGTDTGNHAHPWGQLVYATRGVVTVHAASRAWVVPAYRAVWVPAALEHSVASTGRVALQTLYFAPALTKTMTASCHVILVSPLLRELILEVRRHGMLRHTDPAELRLAHVVVDQLRATPQVPLDLAMPRDRRALRVAQAVRADLERTRPLAELARGSGASTRTIERLFIRETGFTFSRWRQRARAFEAMRLLADGRSVTEAGLLVGYDSTSAFIAMFRRITGATPLRWLREDAPANA